MRYAHIALLFTATFCFSHCGRGNIVAARMDMVKQYRKVAVTPVEIYIDSSNTTARDIKLSIQNLIAESLKKGGGDASNANKDDEKAQSRLFQDSLADTMNRNLLSRGFLPVERSRVQAILDEFGIQQTGLFDQKKAHQIGKMTQADALFIGKLHVKEQKGLVGSDVIYTFSGRLVTVNEGYVLLSGDLSMESDEDEMTLSEIRHLIDRWFDDVEPLD